jgi:hypothetical protein
MTININNNWYDAAYVRKDESVHPAYIGVVMDDISIARAVFKPKNRYTMDEGGKLQSVICYGLEVYEGTKVRLKFKIVEDAATPE